MGNKVRRIALLGVVGLGLMGAAYVGAAKAKSNHAAAVATYEMNMPALTAAWEARQHGPFLKDKFVSKRTGSMITLGESHGDADYVVTPDQDEVALAKLVVQAGEINGWKTLSIGKSEEIGGAHFVFVNRTAGTHTYWTAVGVLGNSSFIAALTVTGTDKEREQKLKDEYPYFRQLVEQSTFKRDTPTLVASR